ncbi:MAG: Xaa-Pro peptidase family protein [Chloroflexota bacterium]
MTFGKFNVDYEQRIYNPERMRKYRIERAHAALKKFGLGALIVYNYDTFRYLGYYSRHNYNRRRPGNFLLLVRDQGFPYAPADDLAPTSETELMPWFKDRLVLHHQTRLQEALSYDPDYYHQQWLDTAAEVKALLKKHDVLDLPCGIDMTSPHMVQVCQDAGIKVVDGNPAVAEMRMIKNEDEIECVRTAASIAESAHWEVCQALKPGVTEWQMAGVAAKALFDLGAEELEGPSFVVCSGYRSGHNVPAMPTDRVVRPGEMFIIDINGVSFQGYRTCFYRTCVVGDKPTEFQKQMYHDCYEVQHAMETSIRPGITNHEYARIVLEKGGGKWPGPTWPEPGRYLGPSGHQLGLSSGDPGPNLRTRKAELAAPPFMIQKGMVFAVEVGCYDWDGQKWAYDGVKLENVGVVRDDGFEVLSRFPYKDLIAVGLPGVY